MSVTDPFSPPGSPIPGGDPFGVPGRIKADYADAEDRAAANLPVDQWSRYRIPSADGIQPAANKGRTRVSTTKGVGQDQRRLQARAERLIVKGLAADPALAAQAAAALKLEDDSQAQRKALAAVALKAFEAAGGNERRDQGTEVHQIIDDITKGKQVAVPDKYQADVAAYFQALEQHDLEDVPGLSELVVLCPYDHGGAIDSIKRRWNADTEMYELVVVDLKTGRTLENSYVEFLSQMWFYANAYNQFVVTGMDRDDTGKITAVRGYNEPLPLELRPDRAIIIHLPMDGTAVPYDLELSGWDKVVAAQVTIRRANAEAKYRYREMGIVRPEPFQAPGYVDADPGQTVEQAQTTNPGKVIRHNDQKYDAFTPTATAPTPDAAAQQQAARDRMEALDRMARQQGRNDDPDDGVPDAAHGGVDGRMILNGLGKPLEPIAGIGQKGCSVCRRVGHRKPKPGAKTACLGDADPALSVQVDPGHPPASPALGTEPIQPDEEIISEVNRPWCTIAHVHPWTAQHPDAPGQWVCAVSGKPGKQAYDAGQTRMTAVPPSYGHPDGEVVAHLAPATDDRAGLGVGMDQGPEPIMVTPSPAQLPPWPSAPVDPIALAIANSATTVDLMNLRQANIERGTWTADLDRAASERYPVLWAQENQPR